MHVHLTQIISDLEIILSIYLSTYLYIYLYILQIMSNSKIFLTDNWLKYQKDYIELMLKIILQIIDIW